MSLFFFFFFFCGKNVFPFPSFTCHLRQFGLNSDCLETALFPNIALSTSCFNIDWGGGTGWGVIAFGLFAL